MCGDAHKKFRGKTVKGKAIFGIRNFRTGGREEGRAHGFRSSRVESTPGSVSRPSVFHVSLSSELSVFHVFHVSLRASRLCFGVSACFGPSEAVLVVHFSFAALRAVREGTS